jgi:hypothetical protein
VANWLQKFINPAPLAPKGNTLLVKRQEGQVAIPTQPTVAPAVLPPASVIYGIAASGLFVIALYFLLTGRWFTGALILLPASCFLGFALHFLRIG